MTLAERLRAQLAASGDRPVPRAADDATAAPAQLREAAVLVAVTDRAEPGVILTRRPDTMAEHPGQVAFPGGRVEPSDTSIEAAALREGQEEIGLDPALASVVGRIGGYRTITGYHVTPVLAVIPPDLPLFPHEREVAAVFEAPLAIVTNLSRYTERHVTFDGRRRSYIELDWGGQRIWGATAAMLVNLGARLS